MSRFGNGVPDAFSAVRVLVGTALVLLAAGAGSMFLYGVTLATGPVDSETTYVHMEAVLVALAGVVVSSCIAIWGLGRGVPRTVSAGAGGVAVASAILMVAAEDVNSSSEYIAYYRAVFVLVLGLAAAVLLVGRRLRGAARDTA